MDPNENCPGVQVRSNSNCRVKLPGYKSTHFVANFAIGMIGNETGHLRKCMKL